MKDIAEDKHALLLLRVAEWWGSLKQKDCGFLGKNGVCTISYDKPVKSTPVEWVKVEEIYLMKPSKLWCLYCTKCISRSLANALEV